MDEIELHWPDRWDVRFMQMAELVASWSKDPSTQVGAVIVDERHRILGVGFNGLPTGIKDTQRRLTDKELKHKIVVHAETNAILNSDSVMGATIYATFFPCPHCASFIIQSGIKRLVVQPHPSDSRYQESQLIAADILVEAGVVIERLGDKHANNL